MTEDVFVATGLTEGEKARLTRLTLGLRQVDLASKAKVNVGDITALEKNRYLPKKRKHRILEVLGLDDGQVTSKPDGSR